MYKTFLIMLPLGLGVFLSPEIWMPGLLLAASKEKAGWKAWFFCLGGAGGIGLLITIGFFLNATTPEGPSWTRFFIRAGLGTLLFFAGIHILFKGEKGPSKKNLSHLAEKAGLKTAVLLGFAVTGLNLKVASLTIAAGHQLSLFSNAMTPRLEGLLLFLGLSLLPVTLPAIVETVKPGLVRTLIEPCNRFMALYGRWIVIAICLVMGGTLWRHALAVLPA
ncbi:MAG: GAP family protein [Deltaproteobacteria bacterium]|nr:GAP family protein [Deltaproteobacteria bacterium]